MLQFPFSQYSCLLVSQLLCLERRCLVPQVLEQGGRQVSFTEGWDDEDDALAGILRALTNLNGSLDGGTTGDTAKDTLLSGQITSHCHGIVTSHLNNFVNEGGVGITRDEASSDSLDLIGFESKVEGGMEKGVSDTLSKKSRTTFVTRPAA